MADQRIRVQPAGEKPLHAVMSSRDHLTSSRSTVFLDHEWTPASELSLNTAGIIPLLASLSANFLPLLLPGTAVRFVAFAVLQVACAVASGMAAKGRSRAARRLRGWILALRENPYASRRFLAVFVGCHVSFAIQTAIFLANGWGMRKFVEVLVIQSPGDQLLFMYDVGLMIHYVVVLAHVVTCWQPERRLLKAVSTPVAAGAGASCGDDVADSVVVPPPGNLWKGSVWFVHALAAFLCISGMAHFLYKSNDPWGSATVSHYAIWALSAATLGCSLAMFIVVGSAMTLELRRSSYLAEFLAHEPLYMRELSPDTLSLWWSRRMRYAHFDLPVLYTKAGSIVGVLCVAVVIATAKVAATVLAEGAGTLFRYDMMVAGSFTPAGAVGVLGLINMEVWIYENGQQLHRAIHYLRLHITNHRYLPAEWRPLAEVREEHEDTLLRLLEHMESFIQHDPFASVFGIPVRPAFRNVLFGYLITALVTVAGKAFLA